MYEYMFTDDGQMIYPAYLDKDARIELRKKTESNSNYLYCSCKDSLYYKVSSDLKIIPCHKHYIHEPECVRCVGDKRNSDYVMSDDGESIAYLKFNPENFNIPKDTKEESSGSDGTSKDDMGILIDALSSSVDSSNDKDKKIDKEPFSELSNFIKKLNYDTYMYRMMCGQKVLSSDYFSNAVIGHLGRVRLSPMRKTVKEIKIKSDNFCFFYAKVTDILCNDKSCRITIESFNKEHSYFVYRKVMEKSLSEYSKMYDCGADPHNDVIMAAGFIYKKYSAKGNVYYTPGRLHLFKTNKNGIYVSSDIALMALDSIFDCLFHKKLQNKVKVILPISQDKGLICQLKILGVSDIVNVYKNKKPNDVACNRVLECLNLPLNEDIVYQFITNLK